MDEKKNLSMLEYAKTILTKMSFDRALFMKEYDKAIQRLGANDRNHLKNWAQLEWQVMFN